MCVEEIANHTSKLIPMTEIILGKNLSPVSLEVILEMDVKEERK
jgi:hypothetical protein